MEDKNSPQTKTISITGGGDEDAWTVPEEASERVVYFALIDHANTGQVVTLSSSTKSIPITLPSSGDATPVTFGGNAENDEILHIPAGETLNVNADGGDVDVVIGSVDR